jgi:FixJ family two-component response regulator
MAGDAIVFVVHEDVQMRRCVRELAESAGYRVEAFSDVWDFVRSAEPGQPGCLVISEEQRRRAEVRGRNALARRVTLPLIVTTPPADVPAAVGAMKAGAFEVIEQPAVETQTVPAVRAAVAADLVARRSRALADEIRHRYEALTPRERSVSQMVATGLTSGAIAKRLGLQAKTVEVYRSHINHKMRARNAAELVQMLSYIT